MQMDMSQEPFDAKICRKNAASGPVSCEPAQSKCTWACKIPYATAGDIGFAQAGQHVTRAFFGEIYKENAVRDDRGHRFMRACAVEMHMDMSQEQFCV